MDHSQVPPTAEGVPEARMVVDVPVTVAGGQPTPDEVAAMVSATMPGKRRRAVYQPQAKVGAAPAVAAPAVAAAAVTPAPPKTGRSKIKSTGPRGNPPSKAKAANRVSLAPSPPKAAVPPPFIPPPPPQAVNDAHNVFGDSSPTEFLSALNNSSVDVADGIPPFDEEIGDEEYDEENGDEEVDDDVVEIEPAPASRTRGPLQIPRQAGSRPWPLQAVATPWATSGWRPPRWAGFAPRSLARLAGSVLPGRSIDPWPAPPDRCQLSSRDISTPTYLHAWPTDPPSVPGRLRLLTYQMLASFNPPRRTSQLLQARGQLTKATHEPASTVQGTIKNKARHRDALPC
ncbi:hypothetical protein ACQ4PT_019109 [Festuca glaucescens]